MYPHITKTRFEPSLIAPATFLIHDHQGEGEGPVSVPLNSMVIRAAEPVVIDTAGDLLDMAFLLGEHVDQFGA